MPVSVTMPQLGESVTEGTVTRWLKAEGDDVQADEPLLEVSTDKVDTEIPRPASGMLTAHRRRRGRRRPRRRRARRHRRLGSDAAEAACRRSPAAPAAAAPPSSPSCTGPRPCCSDARARRRPHRLAAGSRRRPAPRPPR